MDHPVWSTRLNRPSTGQRKSSIDIDCLAADRSPQQAQQRCICASISSLFERAAAQPSMILSNGPGSRKRIGSRQACPECRSKATARVARGLLLSGRRPRCHKFAQRMAQTAADVDPFVSPSGATTTGASHTSLRQAGIILPPVLRQAEIQTERPCQPPLLFGQRP